MIYYYIELIWTKVRFWLVSLPKLHKNILNSGCLRLDN